MLRASCLTLEINEFRCYETKIEKSEKAGSRRESNPGHLGLELPVLCHWATTAKHWRLKPEVSWVWLPMTASLFAFLYFYLIISKFIYLVHRPFIPAFFCNSSWPWASGVYKLNDAQSGLIVNLKIKVCCVCKPFLCSTSAWKVPKKVCRRKLNEGPLRSGNDITGGVLLTVL